MRAFFSTVAVLIASVLGAHALAFVALKGLPAPAVAALGLQSAQTEARAKFEADRPSRSYPRVLEDLARGHLGLSLDGVPVEAELAHALDASLPRLCLAGVLVGLAALGAAFSPRWA